MAKKKDTAPAHGQRHHFFVLGGMPEPLPPKPLEPLSAEHKAKLQVHVDNLKKHMPEMLPIIKELIAEGMIPGLRAVRVKVHTK